MDSNTVILALFALILSFMVCHLMWPKNTSSYQLYIDILDFKKWKKYDDIYTEVLKQSEVPISENEHERTLELLIDDEIVEARLAGLEDIVTHKAPNDSGRTHRDQKYGYTTCMTYEYRLIQDSGGGLKQRLKIFLARGNPLTFARP